MVFVFGSNEGGRHGKGAALFAKLYYGAVYGQGFGLTGESFAIPTKTGEQKLRTLPLPAIREYVERFKAFASEHPELQFGVTRIGCGLAGYQDEQIAPMFVGAPANCALPGIWEQRRQPDLLRIAIVGSRGFSNSGILAGRMDYLISRQPKDAKISLAVIDNQDLVPSVLDWAAGRGIEVVPFTQDEARFGSAAQKACNQSLVTYATHLVAFWDGKDVATNELAQLAHQEQLKVRVVPLQEFFSA